MKLRIKSRMYQKQDLHIFKSLQGIFTILPLLHAVSNICSCMFFSFFPLFLFLKCSNFDISIESTEEELRGKAIKAKDMFFKIAMFATNANFRMHKVRTIGLRLAAHKRKD